MKHLAFILILFSVPFSVFAGSAVPFTVLLAPLCLVVFFTVAGRFQYQSLLPVIDKIRELHDHMESISKRVRDRVRRSSDWRHGVAEALPSLDDRTLRFIVLQTLLAEGYENISDPMLRAIHAEDALHLRKEGHDVLLQLNAEPGTTTTQETIYQFMRALDDMHVPAGIAVSVGPVTPKALELARRNHFQIMDRKTLCKKIVSRRKRVQFTTRDQCLHLTAPRPTALLGC
ncbi:MAG: hypothetical protein CMO80_16600 [Verrucomicrobiales bacterium]|nr:hypothetical protein [Verrucomicrobiales bacterium]|tara:strand:- start:439 stop:1128 length:690 start_codon:yes stop_codon:yes gene_type:complete